MPGRGTITSLFCIVHCPSDRTVCISTMFFMNFESFSMEENRACYDQVADDTKLMLMIICGMLSMFKGKVTKKWFPRHWSKCGSIIIHLLFYLLYKGYWFHDDWCEWKSTLSEKKNNCKEDSLHLFVNWNGQHRGALCDWQDKMISDFLALFHPDKHKHGTTPPKHISSVTWESMGWYQIQIFKSNWAEMSDFNFFT